VIFDTGNIAGDFAVNVIIWFVLATLAVTAVCACGAGAGSALLVRDATSLSSP
jgi:hypothetical protein